MSGICYQLHVCKSVPYQNISVMTLCSLLYSSMLTLASMPHYYSPVQGCAGLIARDMDSLVLLSKVCMSEEMSRLDPTVPKQIFNETVCYYFPSWHNAVCSSLCLSLTDLAAFGSFLSFLNSTPKLLLFKCHFCCFITYWHFYSKLRLRHHRDPLL